MKHFFSLLLFLLLYTPCNAQKLQLILNGESKTETHIIDSLNYTHYHKNFQSIKNEIKLTSEKLKKIGFLENEHDSILKNNDSLFSSLFHLKKPTKNLHIYIGENSTIKPYIKTRTNNDTLYLKIDEVENFLNETLNTIQQAGYPLSKLRLANIKKQNNSLITEIKYEISQKRTIDHLVLKTTSTTPTIGIIPKNYLHQIKKKILNKTLHTTSLQTLSAEFEKIPFITLTKPSEVLFSKDSSIVYVYIEKKKANYFDGFIGFNNSNEKKLQLNGYLDLKLHNALKSGEEFYLNWRNDGNKQTTFKTSLTLSYLFKSPLGLKTQLDIFKQDSIFQNSKTNIDLQWNTSFPSKISLGLESTTSSDIQNNQSTISDFRNQFITLGYHYQKKDNQHSMFPLQTSISIRVGNGKRTTNNTLTTTNNSQFFISANAFHTFYFNNKNSLNLKTQNFYLKSEKYLENELIRFGGLQSIRGIPENSLSGNYVSTLATEYRYHISNKLYLHSILDFGIYQNDSAILSNHKNFNKLLCIGFGTALSTNNGFFTISLANNANNTKDNSIFNTILNLSYNVNF